MTFPAPSVTQSLAEGFAQLLAAGNLGLSWDPAAAYDPTQIGIFIGRLPTGAPNEAVAISPTTLAMHPTFTSDVDNVQIRFRTGARVSQVWTVRGRVRTYLRGRFPLRLPTGVHVASLYFANSTDLGRDDDNRSNAVDNWTVRTGAYRPT